MRGRRDTLEQATVFQGVRIFDGTRVLDENTVVVQDGVITAVGSDLVFPPDASVIEGTGFTLLPGLIDAHAHTFDYSGLRQAPIFGVTTELDMGTYWRVVQQIKVLQQTDEGQDLADLRSAGTMVTAPGGHGTEFGVPIPTLTEPEEAQAFVDARIAEGSDYIKIVYDDRAHRAGQPEPTLRKETMSAVIKAAHRRGKRTVVHVLKLQDARDAIEVGVDGLAHLFVDQMPDVSFAQLAASSHIFVIPTLSVLEYLCGVADSEPLINDPQLSPYLSSADRAQLRSRRPYHFGSHSVAQETVRQLKTVGVPILAGTDAPFGNVHGVSLHHELELLVKSGLTPLEALAAATSVPAAIFDLADRGRIATGLRADLLLVEGDPVSNIRATRAIAGVWKRGKAIDRQAYRRQIRLQQLGESILQELPGLKHPAKR
jgi:imidazolonepropionase-like amidohydrolase